MYFRRRLIAALLFAASQQCIGRVSRADASTKNRRIEFINESGKQLTVEWVDPKTGSMIALDKALGNGGKVAFNTFVNHTFAVHEEFLNETCSSARDAESCNIQLITVSEDEQQGKKELNR